MDHALIYEAPCRAAIRSVPSPSITTACPLRVRTLYSGISRGTERLVFEGRVPQREHARMRAPFQTGDFPFPVKYGYASVGFVEEGPEPLLNRTIFALYPHQTRFTIPREAAFVLPDGLPPRRAVLAANMETALNAVWDAAAMPGDRIAIIGGGVLGAFLAGLCGALPGAEVTLVDIRAERRALAEAMGVGFALPEAAPAGCDIVFHTSASEAGARLALGCAGFEASVVELSWYGDAAPSLPLGESFHSQRLHYVSSQVGQVAASRRTRWDHARRLAKALELLCDERYEALISREVAFADLPKALPEILAPDADGLASVVRYD